MKGGRGRLVPGGRLRLKGRGMPGHPPGDLYAILAVVLPPADNAAQKQAWETLAQAFDFDPRKAFSEKSP